jgi:hypothetical protein
MEVEVGQEVYVPDPDGNPVRGTVQGLGEPADAVEIDIEGKAVKRDIAWVRHDEGQHEGFAAKVPYHEIFPDRESFKSHRRRK